jgi:hypothetical protein
MAFDFPPAIGPVAEYRINNGQSAGICPVRTENVFIHTTGSIKMHPGVKDELACRGFVCRTLHRLGLNVETIKPNGRPAVGIGWVPPEHAD